MSLSSLSRSSCSRCSQTAIALLAGSVVLACQSENTPVPLFEDLGDHAYAISTEVPEAQAYFDQGLRLYYAFNHAEAVRSFRAAQQLDSACAMCWWGEAMAYGPNINLPMDSASGVAAYRAAQRAAALATYATDAERALIHAVAVRYEAVPSGERSHLDSAYAAAMREAVTAFPDDPEIAVLYGESVMDLRPWDYWTPEGELQPGMADALARLERVLDAHANHPGACHFFIHAVEKVHPERAVPCAERLAALMPGAGHIVHMPGHIYIRVGRYLDAVETNRHAVHADETYIQDVRPGAGMYTAGYYPHNYDFLAFAAAMIGRSEEAVQAAEQVRTLIPGELVGTEGMAFLDHWMMRPFQFRVRFAMWDEILAAEEPAADLLHARGLWHYARGRALAATGDLAGAQEQLALLAGIMADGSLAGIRMEFNQSVDLLRIAESVLSGWIAAEAGETDRAIAALEEGVRREDALLYGEPPEWSIPVRHDLGAVLLRAERWREAEQVFRDDLGKFPDNGWSLWGLARSLERQGRDDEARGVTERFNEVWATADVAIDALR